MHTLGVYRLVHYSSANGSIYLVIDFMKRVVTQSNYDKV